MPTRVLLPPRILTSYNIDYMKTSAWVKLDACRRSQDAPAGSMDDKVGDHPGWMCSGNERCRKVLPKVIPKQEKSRPAFARAVIVRRDERPSGWSFVLPHGKFHA